MAKKKKKQNPAKQLKNRTIRPLLNSHPWFASGNYGVDCEFKDNGAINMLIHYAKAGNVG